MYAEALLTYNETYKGFAASRCYEVAFSILRTSVYIYTPVRVLVPLFIVPRGLHITRKSGRAQAWACSHSFYDYSLRLGSDHPLLITTVLRARAGVLEVALSACFRSPCAGWLLRLTQPCCLAPLDALEAWIP